MDEEKSRINLNYILGVFIYIFFFFFSVVTD